MREKNKKGALSIRYLILIIILVVSFGIILTFYYMFDWWGEIDKQACHQSVIYKASVPKLPGTREKIVELPLKCKTEKICITSDKFDKGNCDDTYLGEEYETVKISKDKSKWEEEINKIFADKMQECWWMMGEGKLQLYNRELEWKKRCFICTRIAFDKNFAGEMDRVTGIQKYLQTNKPQASEKTYWQYLTNSDLNVIFDYSEERDYQIMNQKAIVFAEVDKGDWVIWTGQIGGTVAGAAIGSIVPGGAATTVIGAGLGGSLGDLAGKAVDQYFNDDGIAPAWQMTDYDINRLKELDCTSFEGLV